MNGAPLLLPAATRKKLTASGILRWLGAATFVLAGTSFLVEGWTDTSVFQRQLLWAAGTLTMTLLGIFSAKKLKDGIGARVFLGLAAATVPAHFAQLGAAVRGLTVDHIGSRAAVFGAGAILLALLPPLALGVSALVRRRGRTLTALVFALSAPLLLPTRDPFVIAMLGGLQVVAWLALEATAFRKDALFATAEGVAARLLLLAPAVITLTRNLYYPAPQAFGAAVIGWPSLVLVVWPWLWGRTGRRWRAMQSVGILGLAFATALVVPPALPLLLALSVVLTLGGCFVPRLPPVFAWLGACSFALAALASFEPESFAWLALLAVLPVGALQIAAAYRRRSVSLVLFNALSAIAAALATVLHYVTFPEHGAWIPALMVSALLLAVASFVESRKASFEAFAGRLHSHFTSEE